MKFMKFTAV